MRVFRRSGYAALAQWTLHSREHLVLLRPGRLGLLFYADRTAKFEGLAMEASFPQRITYVIRYC
jgi:hypothetical protein